MAENLKLFIVILNKIASVFSNVLWKYIKQIIGG